MNAYEKIEKLKDNDFKLITGITREVFYKMLELLNKKYLEEHIMGGQPGLPVELRLTLALEYSAYTQHCTVAQLCLAGVFNLPYCSKRILRND